MEKLGRIPVLAYLSSSIWASPAQTQVKTVNVVGAMGKRIDLDGYISRLESERKQEHLENLKKLQDGWRRSSLMKMWIKRHRQKKEL